MKVSAVTLGDINKKSNFTNFKSHYDNEVSRDYNSRSSSYGLRKVPVIVLIAMSPINSTNAYSREPISPKGSQIELIQQKSSNKQKKTYDIYKKDIIKSGYETMQFLRLDTDDDKKDAEVLGFNYFYQSEGGYKGLLDGAIIGVCSEPEKDGRYLVAYVEIEDGKYLDGRRVCTVKKPFAEYIKKFANSKENNRASLCEDRYSFISYFGQKKINNAPRMEDDVVRTRDDKTKKIYKTPRARNSVRK